MVAWFVPLASYVCLGPGRLCVRSPRQTVLLGTPRARCSQHKDGAVRIPAPPRLMLPNTVVNPAVTAHHTSTVHSPQQSTIGTGFHAANMQLTSCVELIGWTLRLAAAAPSCSTSAVLQNVYNLHRNMHIYIHSTYILVHTCIHISLHTYKSSVAAEKPCSVGAGRRVVPGC